MFFFVNMKQQKNLNLQSSKHLTVGQTICLESSFISEMYSRFTDADYIGPVDNRGMVIDKEVCCEYNDRYQIYNDLNNGDGEDYFSLPMVIYHACRFTDKCLKKQQVFKQKCRFTDKNKNFYFRFTDKCYSVAGLQTSVQKSSCWSEERVECGKLHRHRSDGDPSSSTKAVSTP